MDEINGQPHGSASERERPPEPPPDPTPPGDAERADDQQRRALEIGEENAT